MNVELDKKLLKAKNDIIVCTIISKQYNISD